MEEIENKLIEEYQGDYNESWQHWHKKYYDILNKNEIIPVIDNKLE